MVVKKRQSINEAESLKVGDVVSVVGQRKPSVVLGVYPDAHAVKVTTVGNVDVDDVKKLSKSEVLSSIKRNLLLDLDVALLIQQGVISANQLDKDIDKDLLKRASKLMGEYNIPRLKESRIRRSKKALKEAINPEYDDGGYASFGIDISYEILDKNTQETIEQGEFYSSNEYILARTESELDIEYKMELRKAIGNNATYQNVLLSYQRPDRMSSYFLVEVDPEDYDLYFAEVEDNQEVSLTIRLTTFSHDEGMQIVGEDVTMDEIFMESQGKTNMQSKKALKEGGGAGYELIFPDYIAYDLEYDNFNDVPDFIELPVEEMENVKGYDWSTGEISGVCGQLVIDKKLIMEDLLSDMTKDEIKNAGHIHMTDFEIERVVYGGGWIHPVLKPSIEVEVLVQFSLYIGDGYSDKHYPYVGATFMPSQLLCDTVEYEYENQYENDDDYYSDDDYYEESQGGKMKSKRALKESLITNGRKPISNLSIYLFKEAQKKSRRKPIVEASTSYIQGALRAKEMDAQAVADLLSDFNADFEAVEEFAEDMGFEAKDVNTFLSAMFEMVIEKVCQEVGCDYDDIADKITYYTNYLDSGMYVVNGDTIDDYDGLVQAIKDIKSGKTNESKKSRRKPIVEAGGDEIWSRVERAKEYLGGGDYLLDDFVKAMSNDAVEDILDYIECVNDIGYDDEQMESLVTERMKKVIKESKQVSNKRALKESEESEYIRGALRCGTLESPFIEKLLNDFNLDFDDVDEYLENQGYNPRELDCNIFISGIYDKAIEDASQDADIDFDKAMDLVAYDINSIGSSMYEKDGSTLDSYGELVSSLEQHNGMEESKQSRRKSPMRESKKPLKESLCMPISGMEYMVYKKGVLGEGSGKVVVIGIATVNGENVTINGTKYNKSQYDFVGTKGY